MSGSWPTPTDWSCRGSPRRPARSFAATVESCKADMPTSANDPAVVCILSMVASTGEPTTATVLW